MSNRRSIHLGNGATPDGIDLLGGDERSRSPRIDERQHRDASNYAVTTVINILGAIVAGHVEYCSVDKVHVPDPKQVLFTICAFRDKTRGGDLILIGFINQLCCFSTELVCMASPLFSRFNPNPINESVKTERD